MPTQPFNPDTLFKTDHIEANLKKHSIKGGAITLASQASQFFIHVGSIVVLARLLSPEDYGLIAMVTAITGFAALFNDMGLSTATIQSPNVTHAQASTVFWLNLVAGLGLMLLISAFAPLIVCFYRKPELYYIVLALSTTFPLSSLSVQHEALLTRQMRFRTLELIRIFSLAAAAAVAIASAMFGFRYWALVLNYTVFSLVLSLGFWLASEWKPSFQMHLSDVRSMLHYGMGITGFNVINYFSRNADSVLIGRFCDAASLGLYSRAYQLFMLPISNLRGPLLKVFLPALSRTQYQHDRYRTYYIELVAVLAFMSMPLIAYLYVCSDSIIRIVLGDKWMGASSLFQILAIVAFIQPVISTRGIVMLSLGQSKRYFWVGTYNAIAMVISFVIGLPWGAQGVATSYAVANYVVLYPLLWYGFIGSPIRVSDFFKAIMNSCAGSIVVVATGLFVRQHISGVGDMLILAGVFISSFITYLVFWLCIPGGVKIMQRYIEAISIVFKRT